MPCQYPGIEIKSIFGKKRISLHRVANSKKIGDFQKWIGNNSYFWRRDFFHKCRGTFLQHWREVPWERRFHSILRWNRQTKKPWARVCWFTSKTDRRAYRERVRITYRLIFLRMGFFGKKVDSGSVGTYLAPGPMVLEWIARTSSTCFFVS